MDTYDAVAVLDGFYDGEVTPELILEASRFIRDHGPRNILAGSGTRNAIELADYADEYGDEAAIESLR